MLQVPMEDPERYLGMSLGIPMWVSIAAVKSFCASHGLLWIDGRHSRMEIHAFSQSPHKVQRSRVLLEALSEQVTDAELEFFTQVFGDFETMFLIMTAMERIALPTLQVVEMARLFYHTLGVAERIYSTGKKAAKSLAKRARLSRVVEASSSSGAAPAARLMEPATPDAAFPPSDSDSSSCRSVDDSE